MLYMKSLDYNKFEGLTIEVNERTSEEKMKIKNDIDAIIKKSVKLSTNTIIFRLYNYIRNDFIKCNGEDIPFEYDYILINPMIWESINEITKDNDTLWNELKDVVFYFNLKLEEQKLVFAYYLFNQGLTKFEKIAERFNILKTQTCFATNVDVLKEVYKKILTAEDFNRVENSSIGLH